jgi:hypothetical protein
VVSNEEVDKAQRPSSPPSGKEDIKEVTPYSSLPDVVQRTDMSVEDKESDQKLKEMSAGVSSTTSGKLLYGVTSFMSSLPLGGEEGLCALSTSSLDTS